MGCTFATLFGNEKLIESVAQQVEHIPFKDGVPGSSPGWFTVPKSTLRDFFLPISQVSGKPSVGWLANQKAVPIVGTAFWFV